jgi:hypothetical protein
MPLRRVRGLDGRSESVLRQASSHGGGGMSPPVLFNIEKDGLQKMAGGTLKFVFMAFQA